jgi:aspartate aminotransferase-like enzyme
MREARLSTLGPAPLHPAVAEALARSIVHRRTEELRAPLLERAPGLRPFLEARDDVTHILGLPGTPEIVLSRLGARLQLGREVAAAEAEYLRSKTR